MKISFQPLISGSSGAIQKMLTLADSLRLFTELPETDIQQLEALEGADINTAKIALANAVTTLCHGKGAADSAAQTARQSFSEGGIADGLPTLTIAASELEQLSLIDAFIQIGLASKGEVRALSEGVARLNNQPAKKKITCFRPLTLIRTAAQIAAGKKRRAVIQLSS